MYFNFTLFIKIELAALAHYINNICRRANANSDSEQVLLNSGQIFDDRAICHGVTALKDFSK